MTYRSSFLTALIVASGLAAGAASVHATTSNRVTYLTFSEPVALPGVTLAAGTYSFELAIPNSPNNLVAVRNKAHTEQYYLGFASRIDRPAEVASGGWVSFGEASRGEAKPISAWYPPESSDGLKFIYRR